MSDGWLMKLSKKISVRIPNKMYDKMSDDGRTNTDIILKALTQYYRGGEPNMKIDQTVLQMYDRQIQILQDSNNLLEKQLDDWKKISIMNMSIWNIFKMKIFRSNENQLLEYRG